jgi:predicted AAA+ superfamily ATPase
MLKRKIYDELLAWKSQEKKLGLLVIGARYIGKTFIIREFGKTYKNFIEINFENQPQTKEVFSGDLDARTLILNLSLLGLGPFEPGQTLIFFDEIEFCPQARTAIKFLVEDGRFDYIESGSLLGVNYKEVSSYPVGYEQHIEMYPLDFEEFLWANGIGEDAILNCKKHYDELTPTTEFFNQRMMYYYKWFLFVGGIPRAVEAFTSQDDFSLVRAAQLAILNNYYEDIEKYAGKKRAKVKALFDIIPNELNDKNKRFILSDLKKGTAVRDYQNALLWLEEAQTIHKSFYVEALKIPLSFSQKHNMNKIYILDSGLLCAMFNDNVYTALLEDDISVKHSAILENAIACELVKKDIKLYYFAKQSRLAIDFVYEDGRGVSILEVKSGKDYKRHNSLDQAVTSDINHQLNRRIVLSKYNIEVGEDGTIYLPLYMSMFL